MSIEHKISPCPFCGSDASVEEVPCYQGVQFSVGCNSDSEASCMGYQSFTVFNTRGDAIDAWNRRPAKRPKRRERGGK